jgi:ribonuclease M5
VIKVKQAIVVEGRYDKNTLSQIVDATIFTTDGFGIMHDKKKLALLRRIAQTNGLIVLTDSDGAGFVIRNYLKGALPKSGVLHAYIPDIAGKEKRKDSPGKEGKLGVEGMRPEVIVQALRDAGATIEGEAEHPAPASITKADLMAAGLSGAGSAARRDALKRRLDLPEHLSTNGLLDALNLLLTREEFLELTSGESI